jgi:hypothetical protein
MYFLVATLLFWHGSTMCSFVAMILHLIYFIETMLILHYMGMLAYGKIDLILWSLVASAFQILVCWTPIQFT